MLAVNIITAFCLGVLVIELLYMIGAYTSKKREGRIAFVRGFKKGKCVIIYLLTIPLYCMGKIYAGGEILMSFFSSIGDAIGLVVMKFDVESIELLMTDSSFYSFVIYLSFVLVILNAMMFTLSLASQRFWCFRRDISAKTTRKNMLYVFGYNQDNVNVYLSDKTSCKFLVGKIDEKTSQYLYAKKIAYYSTGKYGYYIEKAFKKVSKSNKKYTFVINTGDDELNVNICRKFIENIQTFPEDKRKRLFLNLKVYAFGDLKFKAIYEDIVSSAYGTIEYVSKHRKIAVDFVDKYPLTAFMDDRHIDRETTLIKNGVDINVLLIGFGKINRQIFLTSVANNQFLTQGKNGIESKKVNYVVFDKDNAQNNKNLNHDYYRYSDESKEFDEADYLPLPSIPATEEYHKLDVNDNTFYKKIRSVVSRSKNDVNVAVISFGDDLENIDMAQKLIEKRQEWGIENLVIFVRAREWEKEQTLLEQEDCVFIGNEKEVVFNMSKIARDKTVRMAINRNTLYNIEKFRTLTNDDEEVDKKEYEDVKVKSNEKWFTEKSQLERESGLYCSLSLRSKLHLMGLDYVDKDDLRKGLTEQEYFEIYAKDDMPEIIEAGDGTKVIKYTLDFKKSKRRILAEQEHQRWNSFMISKGVIPASKTAILTEQVEKDGKLTYTNGKNYKLRRHGNITTLDGLIEFRKMIAKRDGVSEEQTDVFKYDYQLLDEAYRLLDVLGYKIVKR